MPGPIRIAILANGAQARREAALTGASVTRLGTLGSKAGKLLAGAFAVGGLVKIAGAVGQVGSAYVDSLNKVQSLTGATDAQTTEAAKKLEAQSAQLAKYGQTAGDAAAGVVELTKSGLDLDKSLAAVRSTLVLAKAGELEVADASELVANTLNTFHLRAQRAADIANFLANAANISSSDVTDLAESFKYVSPLAAKSGITLGQTSAVLAELSNSGIKASQAGTSLRGILVALQAPSTAGSMWLDQLGVSVYGVDGKMRPFKRIIDDLRVSLAGVSQEDQNFALKSIFGRNSITAAQVLIQGGSKTLDEYTKGVRRAGAAEDLAASASKGLAGTLGQVKANVTTGAQSLYREYSPALDAAVQSGIEWLSSQRDAANELLDHVGPALKSVADLLGDTASATQDAAGPLSGDLLPALEGVFDVIKVGADALDSLPDGLKGAVVQAALAAVVFPRFATGVTTATTAMRNGSTYARVLNLELRDSTARAQLASNAMTRLSGAAKTAAGVGGMVALSEGASNANSSLGDLATIGGAALLGFSTGGPIGAAIGATVGGLIALKQGSDQSREAVVKSIGTWQEYASTLNTATGAMTEQTKATLFDALQKSGALKQAALLGVSQKTIVNGILGEETARNRLAAAITAQQAKIDQLKAAAADAAQFGGADGERDFGRANALTKEYTERQKNLDSILAETGALQKGLQVTRDKIAVTKNVPRSVVTAFQTTGVPKTVRELAEISTKFRNSPKKLTAIIAASGVDTTVNQVQRVIDKLKAANRTKGDLPAFGKGVRSAINEAESVASQGGARIANKVRAGTSKAKPDLGGFKKSLAGQIGASTSQAGAGGRQVGSALGDGMLIGFGPTQGRLAASAAAAVRAAVAAARAAGQVRSPSRKTRYIGEMLGQGLLDGMARKKADAGKGGAALINAALAGLYDYSEKPTAGIATDNINTAVDSVTSLIEKTYEQRLNAAEKRLRKKLKGKAEDKAIDRATKKSEQAQKAAVASLRDENQLLKANAAQHDRIAEKLKDARDAYDNLVTEAQQYADTVRDAVVASGSVTGLGEGTGFGSVDQLITQLQAKVASAQAYAQTIQALTAAGLNQTNLQQLIDAGVEGGLGTAQAILAGGPSAIAQINTLTGQLVATGTTLGQSTAATMKSAGIQAAAGLVEGLVSQQSLVEAAATQLGDALAKAVKKALKIKSPSQVFRGIGDNTVKGLALGLDQTYVKRQGQDLASALTTGFSAPALDAYMSTTTAAGNSNGGEVTVVLSAQQFSDVEQGRRIRLKLDAHARAGGKARATS